MASPPTLPWSTTLPDQSAQLISYLSTTLSLLSDVRTFVEARSQLEREYGQKLQVLVRKLGEKKDRKATAVCVGEEPSKTWEVGMEKRNTFITCLESHLSLLENTASEHIKLADDLQSQVIDELKRSEKKKDDGKRKIQAYVQQALDDSDKLYAAREKARNKYFESCSENDSTRLKLEKPGTGEKYAKAFEDSTTDMNNAKNDYVLAMGVANETKRRFYGVEMPVITSEIQAMHGSALDRLSTLLSHTATLSTASSNTLASYHTKITSTWTRLNIPQDQDMYADFNIRMFVPPKDWVWEPCPGYYAEGKMELGGAGGRERVYLQNRLGKGRKEFDRLGEVLNGNKQEIQRARQLISQYFENRGLGDPDDVVDTMLTTMKETTSLSMRQEALLAEVSTLEAVLGDDQGVQQPHDFKPASFAIPVPCDYCQTSIWGMSKVGLTCRACNSSVHTKCELKAPANCASSAVVQPSTERRRPPSMIGTAMSGLSRREASSSHGRTSSQDVPSPISPAFGSSHNPLASMRKSFSKQRLSDHGRSGSTNSIPGASEEQIHLPPPHALDANYTGYNPPVIGDTSGSLFGSSSTQSRQGVKTSPTIDEEGAGDPPLVLATVVFAYTAADNDEVSVEKDRQVRLLEPNDGSGWVKIRLGVDKGCKEGLVPADYISVQSGGSSSARPSNGAGVGAQLKTVRALYDYTAQGADEISLVEGQTYTLSKVGKTWGEGEDGGWWELMRAGGAGGVGVAPSNYLQDI